MPNVQNIGIDKFTVATSVSLETLAQGEVLNQFQWCFTKALEDIADQNTVATAPRKISVSIEIKPSEQRSHAMGKAVVKSSTYPNSKPIDFELNLNCTANSISASETYVDQGDLFNA